jgi:electron transfer flavoprotein alpha subunit
VSAAILAIVEHDRGETTETSFQSIGLAQVLIAAGIGSSITAVVIGEGADALSVPGADATVCVRHPVLTDYAPEAWGDAVAGVVAARSPAAVVATGTDRGNEVLAHVAAITSLPFAANVTEIEPVAAGSRSVQLTRVRWGGSLLEHSRLDADVYVMSGAPHVFAGNGSASAAPIEVFEPDLPETAARTRIVDRVTLASGITLTTAAVVVSGGRGVGSAEGFAPLEELAELLGGAVGCSRVVTNNGWRPHSDQVGQTGKRIAPDLYIACGISGAIQHWVGMMAAKHVIAINTDGEANMVGKAEYAVLGDLHAIVPAISAEIRKRRGDG